jgi:hypothetical protein
MRIQTAIYSDKQHVALTLAMGSLTPCPEIVDSVLAQIAGEERRVLDIGEQFNHSSTTCDFLISLSPNRLRSGYLVCHPPHHIHSDTPLVCLLAVHMLTVHLIYIWSGHSRWRSSTLIVRL